jgi:SagB-type dehydrogenase family enzyme
VIGDRWTVEHILDRRRFRLSRSAIAVLIAAARPRSPEDLAEFLAERGTDGRPAEHWLPLVSQLSAKGLLVDEREREQDERLDWLVSVRRAWSRYGWHEAAEYHMLAFDYPCVDYTEAIGILADRDRMRTYQESEPDSERFKLDYAGLPGVDLPELTADLLPASAREVWQREVSPAPVDFSALSKVLAATFGITGLIIPKTDSAPLLRRSSPSGGGRNPTEAYVVARSVDGLEPGWYHVTMQPFSLRRLDGPPIDGDGLTRLFPNTLRRFPLDAKALVVLTTVFERNMYRYREPRTYRTVHMDVGHLAATARIAARSLGLTAAIFYCDSAQEIEQALGLDGLAEGYQLTVAITDGNQGEELRIPARPALAAR